MTSTETPRVERAVAPRDWARGLYAFVFILLFAVAETLLTLLAVLQFAWLIIYREANPQLKAFGVGLGAWMAQVARFQAAETEEKPFPWGSWPGRY